MNVPRWWWVRAAVLLACVYGSVGILFALPTAHVRAWRAAAWIVSAVAFGLHIGFERLRLRSPPQAAALRVALAAALGGFALAVGALGHAVVIGTGSHHQ